MAGTWSPPFYMAQPFTTPHINLVDVNDRACHLKRLGGQNDSEHH